MPKLQIIIGSVRPGRVGLPVAQWFNSHAVKHGGFDVELIDLAEVNLPFMDEANHPRFGRYEHQHTKDWSAKIQQSDAIVVVTPEYNYGYSPALKNAIDYLHSEWAYKPVGFVSYGGVAAGTRAMQQLKQVLGALRMYPVSEAVNLPFVQQFLNDDGEIQPNEIMDTAATALLDELLKIADALAPLRK
jgi:NAD(P)H-dependent FMN reductase